MSVYYVYPGLELWRIVNYHAGARSSAKEMSYPMSSLQPPSEPLLPKGNVQRINIGEFLLQHLLGPTLFLLF